MEPLLGVKSPVEVTIGDRAYKMSPLSDRDTAELDEWVASALLVRAFAASRQLDGAGRSELIGHALREAACISYSDPTGWKIVYTPAGLARLFWQGIKRNHPATTYEEIKQALAVEPGQIREVMTQFKRANEAPKKAGGSSVPLAEPTSTAPS